MTTTQDEVRESTVEQAVDAVVRIGRLWAVYGLEVGRAALRTTSETLRTTSVILGEVSKAIDERRESSEAPATDAPVV